MQSLIEDIDTIQIDHYSEGLLRLWKKSEEGSWNFWFLSYQVREQFFGHLKPNQFESLRSRLKEMNPPPKKLTQKEREFIVKFFDDNSRGPLPWLLNLKHIHQ